MTRYALIAAGLALVSLGLCRLVRTDRVNRWTVRNLPVAEGPILCFGDSLVEGVGASTPAAGYPAQLESRLGRRVVAHGVSGMTAEAGLERLRREPDLRAPLVIVTLGGNDLLGRLPLAETRAALAAVFVELQARGAVVAFTEVLGVVPGERARMHREICRRHGVILVPDIMAGMLRDDDLRADAIHPNDAGYALVADRVAARLRPYLENRGRRR